MKNSNDSSQRVVHLEKESLKRILKTGDLVALGYGDLGSSIYYALGLTALFALGATPIAFALAGFVFICTALTYAEMTSMFQESGGSASFARYAFNDLISFIAGWGLLLDYIVTIAISIFAIGPYLTFFFHYLHAPDVQVGFAIGLIAVLLILNIFGIKQSMRVSFILAVFTILTQLLVIGIGLFWLLDLHQIAEDMRIAIPNKAWSPSWSEFWKGTSMAMVAYTGIESIAQLGSEAKKPAKTVPRAIIITMVILIVLYLGISLTALSALSPLDLGTKYLLDPIAGIVDSLPFGSQFLTPWVGLLAAGLLFIAGNAGLIGASRLSYNMSEYYQLPRFFYQIHSRFRTPCAALIFFASLAILIILLSRGRLAFLADLYNFGAQLAFFFAHLSLIALRIRYPDQKRPFFVRFNIRWKQYAIPIHAVIGCLATFSVWVLVVITKPEGRFLGFSWMALGLLMYFYYRKKRKIAATGQITIEKVRLPGYSPFKVNKILLSTGSNPQPEVIQMACEMARFHKASLTAVAVLEVPPSLPLDSYLPHRMVSAQTILKRAEAVARDLNVEMSVQVIRSRSISGAILDLIEEGKFDLLILGSFDTATERAKPQKNLGIIGERIAREASCRVLTFLSPQKNKTLA
jgi:basic amino acid/polyamine antiporter, APA family